MRLMKCMRWRKGREELEGGDQVSVCLDGRSASSWSLEKVGVLRRSSLEEGRRPRVVSSLRVLRID
jgi:hypothetical protein